MELSNLLYSFFEPSLLVRDVRSLYNQRSWLYLVNCVFRSPIRGFFGTLWPRVLVLTRSIYDYNLTKIQSRRSCRRHDFRRTRGPWALACGFRPWTPPVPMKFWDIRKPLTDVETLKSTTQKSSNKSGSTKRDGKGRSNNTTMQDSMYNDDLMDSS
jgi:hypothetical protein